MNKTKVSIIVPVYNVEKYLPCCMDSLLNQTLKDIEIIMVDDGSPDNCPSMCDEYAKHDHRIQVIHKKNAGLGYARNSGLEIATGEYIGFVDSDDYVDLGMYQRLYDIATNKKADVVFFNHKRFDNKGNVWMNSNFSKVIMRQTMEDIRGLILDMIGTTPDAENDREVEPSVWGGLYRNDLIRKHDIIFKSERELFSEDLLFNIDYLLHSSNVLTIPEDLYYYRVNLSSLSQTIRPDFIDKIDYFYKYLLKILTTNNFGKEGYLRATRLFIGYSSHCIDVYFQSSLSNQEKIQWLKKEAIRPTWQEIASVYPYKRMPWKQALSFYLLYKGYCHLLYYIKRIRKIIKK